MSDAIKSIRPFIGAKDYELSRSFYRELGFQEVVLFHNMCLFKTDRLGFYLQNAYVEDWINNSMIFLEVEDIDVYYKDLLALDLPNKYKGAKLSPVKQFDWGKECYLHDPSGILLHFGEFSDL